MSNVAVGHVGQSGEDITLVMSHNEVPGFSSYLYFLFQLIANVHPETQQLMSQTLEAVPLRWEARIETQASGFGLAHLWLMQTFGK